jgi:hypothetical protein
MAHVSLHIQVYGLDEMRNAFVRGGKGPGFKVTGQFESALKDTAAAVHTHVHVQTGYLQSTGLTNSHFTGTEWEGEITYAHDPGIYELDRGDTPTANHPEGGHGFYDAVEPFVPVFDEALNAYGNEIFGPEL